MTDEKDKPYDPVARLREQFWDRKRSRKPSPLIREIYEIEKAKRREKASEPPDQQEPDKKIARPKDPEAGV